MTKLVSVEIPCPYCDKLHTVELSVRQFEEFDGFHPCTDCESQYQEYVDNWVNEQVEWVTKDW